MLMLTAAIWASPKKNVLSFVIPTDCDLEEGSKFITFQKGSSLEWVLGSFHFVFEFETIHKIPIEHGIEEWNRRHINKF